MKVRKYITRAIFTGFIFTVLMVSPSLAKKTSEAQVAATPMVKLIGIEKKNTLLHISIKDTVKVKFALEVVNAKDEIIYSQNFETAKFSKYLNLIKEGETGLNEELKINIRMLPDGIKHSFNIAKK